MKNISKIIIAFCALSNFLMAQGYYPANYNTSYTNWNYRPSYCPQAREQTYRSPIIAQPFEKQHKKLVIMFTREDCGFCRYMKPIMQQVQKKFGKDIKFLYIDVAQNPGLASQYNFSTVPHIVYFKNGKQLDAHGSGDKTMTRQQVEEKIRSLGLIKKKTRPVQSHSNGLSSISEVENDQEDE